jgi:hypothetical protein
MKVYPKHTHLSKFQRAKRRSPLCGISSKRQFYRDTPAGVPLELSIDGYGKLWCDDVLTCDHDWSWKALRKRIKAGLHCASCNAAWRVVIKLQPLPTWSRRFDIAVRSA